MGKVERSWRLNRTFATNYCVTRSSVCWPMCYSGPTCLLHGKDFFDTTAIRMTQRTEDSQLADNGNSNKISQSYCYCECTDT